MRIWAVSYTHLIIAMAVSALAFYNVAQTLDGIIRQDIPMLAPLKSDFILSMCELIVGGKDGLQPVEKTIIDRSVRMVYQEFLADPQPEKMTILEDLYNILRNQKEPEAQRIATALEIYVHGSLNVFNHRTNVDVNNRFVLSLIHI